jgi:hypothetical protein
MSDNYDVVAVSLDDGKVLWVEEKKTKANAKAIVTMAVMRQGVEDRFFGIALAGKYEQGDLYTDSGLEEDATAESIDDYKYNSEYITIGNTVFPRGHRGL